jgi:hypothetical protein
MDEEEINIIKEKCTNIFIIIILTLIATYIIGIIILAIDLAITGEFDWLGVFTWGFMGKRPIPVESKEGYNYLPLKRNYGGYYGNFYRKSWMPWYYRTYYYPNAWRYIAYPSTSAYNSYGTPGLQTYYL